MQATGSARQFGISIILLTLLFRLFETGFVQKLLPEDPIDKETGRNVRSYSMDLHLPFPFIAESSPPNGFAPERPAFTREDAQTIALVNYGKETPDLGALLAQPLELHLTGEEPTVLILHTHTTESYTGSYPQTSAYRSLEEEQNMLAVGERVMARLEQEGIHVIHDRRLHDYPAYDSAYSHSRRTMRDILAQNPGIQLVLDLHRDAADNGDGQLRTHATICGKSGAQLMIVACCGSPSLSHPHWQENLALALKLQVVLEQQCPGITRPISLRTQRFNQDLSPGALLIEVGAAGNTQAEAMLAADQLAMAVIALKDGTEVS